MSVYALDTNTVSYLLQKRERVTQKLSDTISQGHFVRIPPIVYYEIRRGLLYKNAISKNASFLDLYAELGIDSIDRNTLEIAARTYAYLRKSGQLIEDTDILIAAYCIRNDYILVTNNVKHFNTIRGLDYVNWL